MGLRGSQTSRWRWLGWTAIVLACMIAGLQSRPQSKGEASAPAALAATIGRPFAIALTWLRGLVTGGWETVTGLSDLQAENSRLRAQLEAQSQMAVELAEAKAEVARLQGLVAVGRKLDAPAMPARVIARGPSPWFQIVIIDHGEADGVRPGAAVLSAGGLLGQVYEVSAHSARVLCITDRLGSVGARLQPDRVRHVTGVAKGDGEASCILTSPIFDADVKAGDAVVTSGQEAGSLFPAGLPVGRVTAVESRPQESLLVCTIQPAVDPRRVEAVLVRLGDAPVDEPELP